MRLSTVTTILIVVGVCTVSVLVGVQYQVIKQSVEFSSGGDRNTHQDSAVAMDTTVVIDTEAQADV